MLNLKNLFYCFLLSLPLGAIAQSGKNLSAQSYKCVTTNKVLLRLCATLASNTDTDTLALLYWKKGVRLPTKSKGAWYDADEKSLNIQEELYDLCTAYGADSLNALAFVISHEMAHYHQRQSGRLAECALFNASEINPQKLAAETDADIQGLLTARIAGFKTIPIHHFIQDFYVKFNLPDEMLNYPTKAERIVFFEKDAAKANEAYALFETATLSQLIDEPKTALVLYDTLLLKYRLTAPEILNNTATAILRLVDKSTKKSLFKFPFGIYSRLSGSRTANVRDTEITAYLQRADTLLQRAAIIQPNSTTIRKNQFILRILAELQTTTVDTVVVNTLIKDIQKDSSMLAPYHHVLLGICAKAFRNDAAMALKYFKYAEKNGIDQTFNVARLKDEHYSEKKQALAKNNTERLKDTLFTNFQENQLIYQTPTYWFVKTSSPFYVAGTDDNYTGTTGKGVKIGMTEAELIEIMGKNNNKYEAEPYSYLFYENMVFKLTAQKTVQAWLFLY